jgi:hypothetical protein
MLDDGDDEDTKIEPEVEEPVVLEDEDAELELEIEGELFMLDDRDDEDTVELDETPVLDVVVTM